MAEAMITILSVKLLTSHPLNWPSQLIDIVSQPRITHTDNVSIYWYDIVILHASETSKGNDQNNYITTITSLVFPFAETRSVMWRHLTERIEILFLNTVASAFLCDCWKVNNVAVNPYLYSRFKQPFVALYDNWRSTGRRFETQPIHHYVSCSHTFAYSASEIKTVWWCYVKRCMYFNLILKLWLV